MTRGPYRRMLWGTALAAAVAVVPLAGCGGGGAKASRSSTSTAAPGAAGSGSSASSEVGGSATTGKDPSASTTTPGGPTGPGASTTTPGTGSDSGSGNGTGSNGTSGSGSTAAPETTAPRRSTTTTQPSVSSGSPSDAHLDAAYAAAWKTLCREVWGHSTDGKLYEPDDTTTSYTVSECLDDLDVSYRYDTTLASAASEGRQDAIDDLFGLGYSGYFCWLDSAQNIGGCFNADKGTYGPPPPP